MRLTTEHGELVILTNENEFYLTGITGIWWDYLYN